MFKVILSILGAGAAACLTAQTPAVPGLKFRGSLWTSAVAQDRDIADGSMVLRPMESGQGQVGLDGALLGVDAVFPKGWSARATLLAGQAGKVVQATNGETGTLSAVEAMLVWTGPKDTLRIGRMITFIGMEFLDGAQNVTASRGLLFSFVDPFGQVGVNWHHSFSASWSADLFAFNGEDRVKDNNRGKTLGLGLTYNHGGSQDDYLSLHAYRGAEQDGFGASVHSGAEGRMRERLCLMGQGVAGRATLQAEVSLGRERFEAAAVAGASAPVRAYWRGYGLIAKLDLGRGIGLFARIEQLSDDVGVRLSADPTLRAALGLDGSAALGLAGAGLRARNLTLGVEKKHGPAFVRVELRQDGLDRSLRDQDLAEFRRVHSGTISVGASF